MNDTNLTPAEHLISAYKTMKAYGRDSEEAYWDIMLHIHDAYHILEKSPQRWGEDKCICAKRDEACEKGKLESEEKCAADGYRKIGSCGNADFYVKD